MLSNRPKKILLDLRPVFSFTYGLTLLLPLLISGCAGFGPGPGGKGPEERAFQARALTFPDFVAVVPQKGDTFSSLASKFLNDPSMGWFISEFNGLESPLPGQALIIPLKAYDKGGLTPRGYQTVPVLSYHQFSINKKDTMTIKASTFENQMRFLKENGFRVIGMDELFEFLEFKRQIPEKSVVITIDDGWRSTYDIAFPILKKYGYPATLFVYTDLITGNSRTLDWDLIREMAEHGVNIQCHTKTHRSLSKRKDKESFKEYFESIRMELTESARIIKNRLGKEVRYLAYPYGDTNQLVVALLIKLGYRGAFTVERGSTPFFEDPYRINRSMIYGDFDLKTFARNLDAFRNEALK